MSAEEWACLECGHHFVIEYKLLRNCPECDSDWLTQPNQPEPDPTEGEN